MVSFKHWCRIVCVTVIASGVLLSFLPEFKLKNTYKGFVSIILIFVILSPMSEVKEFGNYFENTAKMEKISEEELVVQSSGLIIECAEKLLNERLNIIIKEKNLDAECKSYLIEKNSEAHLKKIEVSGTLTSEEEKEIYELLTATVGGDTEIEFIG